ncbi:MAG: hypothetical protein ACT4NV_15215 [Rhodoferax sp.]
MELPSTAAPAMQSYYPELFERDMACTEAEWLQQLPAAVGDCLLKVDAQRAGVRIGDGALGLQWQVAEPRTIALVRLPRLLVRFRFGGVDEAQRQAFMRRFDLYMQRGGG